MQLNAANYFYVGSLCSVGDKRFVFFFLLLLISLLKVEERVLINFAFYCKSYTLNGASL